jgi:5-methylcytosine-specific restriction endonuclease McrA
MLRRYPPRRAPVRDRRRQDPVPAAVRAHVRARDGGCVFARLGTPHDCFGRLELDHVRASGGLGLRSRSTPDNLVLLCPSAHRLKTLAGRRWRPVLLAWIEIAERQDD